ncbi:MAG TPA: Wzz/FepE/Etk N-terminal domain-containing protein [Ramlibacter sp.]
MSLSQFFSILRARRALAGFILLSTLALALGWVLLRPASYRASAPVLVDVRMDPTNATPLQGMVAPTFMSTQVDIIKSDRVAQRVVQLLPPDQAPMKGLREQAGKQPAPDRWIAATLQRGLDVKPARETNIINITWVGRTPAEAARVANAFAQAYLETNLDIKTEPAKKYTVWFDQQVQDARNRLDQAQQKLAAFEEKAGIVTADEKSDFETTRLNELLQQLSVAQSRGIGGSSAGASDSSPLVNNLRQDVAREEAKIAQASATMGSRHPEMMRMQSELAAMKARLAEESHRVGITAVQSAEGRAERIRALQTAINDQKQKVLSLNRQRAEASIMKSDVDSAQKAFDTVTASAAQARLQSMSNQTNVMKLAPAVEPMQATGPTATQAMLIGLAVGLVLAIAGALMAELANRRVRTAADLSLAAHLPILATVPAANASRYQPLHLAGPSSRRLALARSAA